jgi:ferrous iron transport protein B
MGVILGLLGGHAGALLLWGGVVGGAFLTAGLMAAKILPGERPTFYMELPPLRLPRLGNVLVKTGTRMVWYFKEVLPTFLLASAAIWVGQRIGLFDLLVRGLQPVVRSMGLPEQSAVAFLFGFFRRDYGVAGLYDLHSQGLLNNNQLAVASIALTLFLPCIAQFLVMRKERGLKMALSVGVFVGVVAYAAGFAVNGVLNLLGVQL